MAKKSANVPSLFVMAVSAALLANGCGQEAVDVRNCVDSRGFPLPDYYCQGIGGGYYGSHIIVGHPVFVYGGTVSGGQLRGYSTTPREGATVKTPGGEEIGRVQNGQIKRNGFGGSGGSFGG